MFACWSCVCLRVSGSCLSVHFALWAQRPHFLSFFIRPDNNILMTLLPSRRGVNGLWVSVDHPSLGSSGCLSDLIFLSFQKTSDPFAALSRGPRPLTLRGPLPGALRGASAASFSQFFSRPGATIFDYRIPLPSCRGVNSH